MFKYTSEQESLELALTNLRVSDFPQLGISSSSSSLPTQSDIPSLTHFAGIWSVVMLPNLLVQYTFKRVKQMLLNSSSSPRQSDFPSHI
jgi:hypothetical protein